MARRSKRFKRIFGLFDPAKRYALEEAVTVLQRCPAAKFDESVEVALSLGVDPKKVDQQVRGTVILPHGTGKEMRIVVLVKEDRIQEALDAGADRAGRGDLLDEIAKGRLDFDVLIATPDMMRDVGKVGKILGPRGLMPTPKAGTVATDIKRAIGDLRKGKVEFRVDKNSGVNRLVGKLSFPHEHLVENIRTLLLAISRSKPPASKGRFIRSLFLSSTMGPGIGVDLSPLSLG